MQCPPDAWSRVEGHVAVGLGGGGVQGGPDVDTECWGYGRQLVDERDVDLAKVFSMSLAIFRLARALGHDHGRDQGGVELCREPGAAVGHPGDQLGVAVNACELPGSTRSGE
jgi:hypothetical protein